MLTLPLLFGLATEAAQAQVLVSNIGQTDDGSPGSTANTRLHAGAGQAFTTGSHVKGYTLTGVGVVFEKIEVEDLFRKNNPYITVTIRNESGGSVGTTVGTLNLPSTSPATFDSESLATDKTFTFIAPGKGIKLEPSSTYFVVIEAVGERRTDVRFRSVDSNAENDGGAAGFSIADTGAEYRWYGTPQGWRSRGGSISLQIGVNGEPILSPHACAPAKLLAYVDDRIAMATTNRWVRIKNALYEQPDAITLAEVREIHDRRLRHGWSLNRLDEVIAAMECMARGLPSSAPVISISAGDNITEGGTATFTLTADPAPTSGLTVAVQMKNININVADDDGDIRTRELTIGTNGTATIDIRTLNDSNQWPDGTVYVAVQPGTSYRVAPEPDNAASVGVANDDFASSYPRLSVADATVSESARNCVRGYFTCMMFKVTLSRALTGNERVDFTYEARESSPVSATAREDFYPVEGVATFKPGDALNKTIEVHIYDDYVSDSGEIFELVIEHAWGATIADGIGVGTINNDDPLPATVFSIPSAGFSSEVGFLDPAPRSSLELDLWNREQPAGAQRGFTPNLATGACVSPGLLSEAAGYAGEIWRGPAHVERWLRVMQTFSGSASDATIVTPAEAQHYAIGGADAWLPVATALRCLEAQFLGGALLQ